MVQAREPRSTRDHCHDRTHGCHFYSTCIESVVPCGHEAFTLSYAKTRCKNINTFSVPVLYPGVSSDARDWAHSTEKCFQDKLLDLADKYSKLTSTNPHDPHMCLNLEEEAIKLMDSCYVETEGLESLSDTDLAALVELFRVDPSYHNLTVDRGLVAHIGSRKSQSLAQQLLSNHTLTMPQRLMFCIRGTKYTASGSSNIDPEEYAVVLKAGLNSAGISTEGSNFQYAGDYNVDSICNARLDDEDLGGLINTADDDYHLVSWFTTPQQQDTILLPNIDHSSNINNVPHNFAAVAFELTTNSTRQKTRCGDGIRQVSESCDFAGSYPGCSLDCRPMEGYDCTVGKLAPSVCWEEQCGDGLRTRSEQCDDGNSESGDGCSSACDVEETHSCTQSYNKTSECSVHLQEQAQQVSAKVLSQPISHVTARRAPDSSSHAHAQEKRTVEPAAFASSSSKLLSTWTMLAVLVAALSMLR